MKKYICEYNYAGRPESYVVEAESLEAATEMAKARAKKDQLFLNSVKLGPQPSTKK